MITHFKLKCNNRSIIITVDYMERMNGRFILSSIIQRLADQKLSKKFLIGNSMQIYAML